MAGLIAALFGGKSRPPDPTDPAPGIGGYAQGPGPTGDYGYPGSTGQTRTFKGRNARLAKVRSDTNTGFEQALSDTTQTRQVSYRGDVPHAAVQGPRSTPRVATRQPVLTEQMQDTPGTFYGGPTLKTGPGNNTAGAHPLSAAAAAGGHSMQDTQTPWRNQVPLGGDAPGSANVRNEIAQRYKARPGELHTYKSRPRADQAPVNRSGQASDGNVHPDRAVQDVTVPSRFVMQGAQTIMPILREMPYGGRGNGARGAQLSGQRFYATGQEQQFWNAGQGNYGIARELGAGGRPVGFTEPAPWTAQFYDTTQQVENGDTPQAPNAVYVSPSGGRASNSTGRTG